MDKILLKWLSSRIDEVVRHNEKDNFVEVTKNGYVIASLLRNYNLISREEKGLVVKVDEKEILKTNWAEIAKWLKRVNIQLTEDDLTNIVEGRRSILLRLFWHLFLFLDKKERISFIDRQKLQSSTIFREFNKDILKNKHVRPDSLIIQDTESMDSDLDKWKNTKQKELQKIYGQIRKSSRPSKCKYKYKIPVSKTLRYTNLELKKYYENIKEINKKMSCSKVDYTYGELEKLNKDAEEMEYFCDCDWTQGILDKLQLKIQNVMENTNLQRKIKHTFMTSLQESLVEEENAFSCELIKKLMKIQLREKQIYNVALEKKQEIRNKKHERMLTQQNFEVKRKKHISSFLSNLPLGAKPDTKIDNDNEEKNQLELHRILYQERLNMKQKRLYEMCKEIILAIINYVFKCLEFKMTVRCNNTPGQFIEEWKTIFCKFQPVFDDARIEESVSRPEDEDDLEIDTILNLKEANQYTFREEDFIEYHNKLSSWMPSGLIPNYDPSNDDELVEYNGDQVLRYVVYNILTAKYPLPPAIPPADLPNFSIAAVVIDVPDHSIINAMKILLKHKGVTVICVEDTFNYCLNMFKNEMAGVDDEIYDHISKIILVKGDSVMMESIALSKQKEPSSPENEKYTQTPKTIPEENIVLSVPAELGKYAYESLTSNRIPTDYLTVAMIIEYLKSLNKSRGFVLINYPQTYTQAKILEEALTGKDMPRETSVAVGNSKRKNIIDPYIHLRRSKLVSIPQETNLEAQYETYFTAYIKLKRTNDESQESCIWDLNEKNSTSLDRFYADQGCNYSLYYESTTKDVLSKICRYIIGDFTLPLKNLDDLFGDNVFNDLKFPNHELEHNENKMKQKKYSKNKLIPSNCQLSPVIDNPVTVSISSEHASTINEFEEESVISCKTDWEFAVPPQMETFIYNLASLWETMEKNYINDMGKFCFTRRLALYHMSLYIRYVHQRINKVLTKPCRKQDLISNYQNRYNDAVDKWHASLADKKMWHCEIKDVQSQLYDICDKRKMEIEMELKNIISENWARNEMNDLVNIFISATQTEVTRSALTLQILEDFYLIVSQEIPSENRVQFEKILFNEAEGPNEDKYVIKLHNAVKSVRQVDKTPDNCKMKIEISFKFAAQFIKRLHTTFIHSIEQMRKVCENENYIVTFESFCAKKLQEGQNLKSIRFKAFDEWSMGISGEHKRIDLRLQMLMYRAYSDLSTFEKQIGKLFTDVFDEINDTYKKEIQSVDQLCLLLQLHVEKEEKIRAIIEFEYGLFFFDSSAFQYLQPAFSTTESVDKLLVVTELEICDLVKLRSQFKLCSLDGQIRDSKCIYVLQDFCVYLKDNYAVQPVHSWIQLDENQIPELVFKIFGETPYVDWRDFLIYCLGISFPTLDELLDLRIQFTQIDHAYKEVIFREDFMRIPLWYESHPKGVDSPERGLQDDEIKIFLFELFECESNLFNYTAFLLAFCKDLNPKSGFVKAASVVIGERVDFDEEALDKVQMLIDEKFAEREATRNLIRRALSDFIDHVIDMSENSNKIQEINLPVVDKKRKKNILKVHHKSQTIDSPAKFMGKSRGSIATDTKNTNYSFVIDENFEAEESVFVIPSPVIVYAVNERILKNIFEVCLPWHFKLCEKASNYVKDLNEVIDVLSKDTDDGKIYVCKFLQTNFVRKLLASVHKFTERNINDISNEIINTSSCQNVRPIHERG